MLDSRQIPNPSPRPSVILRPGMPVLPPGVERYRVRGGSVTLKIFAGDEVTVTDLEGLQPCALMAADNEGRCDARILGAAANIRGTALAPLLVRMRAALGGRAVEGADALRVFGGNSRAGEQVTFAVSRDGILIVHAPGS